MKMINFKQKNIPILLLWIGLGMIVVSIVANLILSLCGEIDVGDQNNVLSIGNNIIVSALIIIVLCPLAEEFIFRFWGKDTKVAYIVDVILIPIMVYLGTTKWWLALGVLIILLAIFFLLKDSKRFIAMTILTAVVFSLLHLINRELSLHNFFYIIQLMGLSLVCTGLCVKYGFLWAWIAHSISNLLAFSLSLVPTQITTDTCSLKITPLYEKTYDVISKENGIVIKGHMTLIANLIIFEQLEQQQIDNPMERNTFYRTYRDGKSLGGEYALQITPRLTESQIDYTSVIKALEDNGFLFSDTTYENKIMLSLENENILLEEKNGESSTIEELINDLRIHFEIPVVPDPALNYKYPIKIDWDEFLNLQTFDECDNYIRRTYGLSLTELKHDRVQVITFKNSRD